MDPSTAPKISATYAEPEVERLLLEMVPRGPYKGKAYSVGGFVRDSILGRPSDDLDITIHQEGGAQGFVGWLKAQLGEQVSTPRKLGAGYPIWHLAFKQNVRWRGEEYHTRGGQIDVADTQKESFPSKDSRQRVAVFGTLEEDCQRRDFTVNMLVRDLTEGKIIDLPGTGLKDLEEGLLRVHPKVSPDKIFSDDPLRIVRLIRFMSVFGWRVDPATFQSAKKLSPRVEIVAHERLHPEFKKMVLAPWFGLAIQNLTQFGLISLWLPACVAAFEEFKEPQLKFLVGSPEQFELRLAALFTMSVQGPRLGSEVSMELAARLVQGALEPLKFTKHEIATTKLLLLAASGCAAWLKEFGDSPLSARAKYQARKWLRRFGRHDQWVGPWLGYLFDSDFFTGRDLWDRVIGAVSQVPVSLKPILNGGQVVQITGLKPGPELGLALTFIQDMEDLWAVDGQELSGDAAAELLRENFSAID